MIGPRSFLEAANLQEYWGFGSQVLIWLLFKEIKGGYLMYSGGSNSEHSNTENIRIPNVLKIRFRMVDHLKTEQWLV